MLSKLLKIAILLFIVTGLAMAWSVKPTAAEMATVRDWIGFFKAGTSGTAVCGADYITNCDSKAGAVNGNSWVYTSSCTQTPGTAPSLERKDASACNFSLSPAPPDGSYEFRLYANDKETADALIATSRWISVGQAATSACGGGTSPRAEGLVTTPDLSGKFSTTGRCVEDIRTVFNPVTFELKSYRELKTRYFDQAKTSDTFKKIVRVGDASEGGLSACLDTNDNTDCFDSQDNNAAQLLIYITGNVGFNGSLTGSKTAVVFIDGNLDIGPNPGNQYTYGNANTGMVIVVKGNVRIDPAITRIDAAIFSDGTIYTAGDGCAASSVNASPLTINGSLVSLSSGRIAFCRTLTTGNVNPAEIIVQQPKYLVILRDLLSETVKRWAEVTTESVDPLCNTKTEVDCTAWVDQNNTCSGNNSSRTCTNSTYNNNSGTYCIRNNYTEYRTVENCDTGAGYNCSGGRCLQDCNATAECSGPCNAPTNTCNNNNGTRVCVWTTLNGSTDCRQVATTPQAARCTTDNCDSGYTCNAGQCIPN